MKISTKFWENLETLIKTSQIVIDRPKGSAHPRFPEKIYPLDYGYLEGTSSADQDGVDVWIGSLWAGDTETSPFLHEIVVTVDLFKRDVEIKILLGCTAHEIETIVEFVSQNTQAGLLICRDN